MKRWSLFLTLAACKAADPAIERPVLDRATLHVDAEVLRDALDRQVLLRGVAVGGRSKLPPFYPFDVNETEAFEAQADDFFGRIADLGAGAVRLGFVWEALEPTRGTIDEVYLGRYVAMLDAAHAHDLGVIVEFHQDLFSRALCGDGFPLWATTEAIDAQKPDPCPGFPDWGLAYLDATSAANQAMQRLWDNEDGLRDDFVSVWRRVASATKDHPATLGFEILNEPPSGTGDRELFEAEVLPAFYEVVGAALREEAGDEPIIVLDGRAGDALGTVNERFAKPALTGLVYGPHYYNAFTVGLGLERVDAEAVHRDVGNLLALAHTWGAPGLLGEFGIPNTNAVKREYLAEVYDALDVQLAHAMQWDVTRTDGVLWNGENFSALNPDGSERDWVGVMDRPVPRAVAGRIVAVHWDEAAADLVLDLADMTEGVSEIYLPARHLGAVPAIEVDGADWRWDEAAQLLLLRAEPGASVQVRAGRG